MDEEVKTEETQETKTEETQETKTEEQTIAKDRFDEVNTELRDAKSQIERLQQQAALAAANTPPTQTARPQFDIYKEVGLNPDDPNDLPNQKQLKQINQYLQRAMEGQFAEMRFLLDHPDFPQMVGTAEQIKIGQYAEPLANALKENPALQAMIVNSRSPRVAAYEIAKLHQKKIDAGEEKPSKKEAQEVIKQAEENAKRTKSLSTVKGGAALSEEGRYANMTDEQILEKARSHGAFL